MTDLEKKILTIAQKHPQYDEKRAVAELNLLSGWGLVENLWSLYDAWHDKPGTNNKLNSALSYYIGITKEPPSGEFTLEPRRTYGRSGWPDVDMDFDYLRRHEIMEYLIDKYGREQVGNIGTIQTLKTKAAVRRAIKVLDPTNSVHFDKTGKEIKTKENFNFALENEILKNLPNLMKRPDGSFVTTVDEACEEYPKFGQYMEEYPEIRRIASAIQGNISGYGCVANDTVIRTEQGYCRIDQIDNLIKIAYVDDGQNIKYSSNYIAHKTGRKKCYKLTLSNGTWVKVTDGHLIFTDQGCVLFEQIRHNPKLFKVWSIEK